LLSGNELVSIYFCLVGRYFNNAHALVKLIFKDFDEAALAAMYNELSHSSSPDNIMKINVLLGQSSLGL